jgi:hypothetical protein
VSEKRKAERRKHKRIDVKFAVRYAPRQFGSDVPPDLWEAQAVNISQSGAALKLPHRLRATGQVELSLMNHNPPRCISVIGEVVRSERLHGVDMKDAEGQARPAYLVAVEFTRLLEINELAMLRDTLEQTEIAPRDE